MLTRLKVSGFKNLVDVDVRFGPFTCVAGANGVGKSNLFDAIRFLSAIADRPLIDAALSLRDDKGKTADVRSLFHRVGDEYADEMSFEAEMIVPEESVDDLGQEAKASNTFLRYSLTLAYRKDDKLRSLGLLEILKEELVPIKVGDTKKNLLFNYKSTWRESVVKGSGGPVSYLISTEGIGKERVIKLKWETKNSLSIPAATLPRTVLSRANHITAYPTVVSAQKEMRGWQLMQLEPSALRQPDEFNSPTKLDMDGSHLAATLYHLARSNKNQSKNGLANDEAEAQVYSQVANRLAQLIDDVREVGIDRDERRELLTLIVTDRDGTALCVIPVQMTEAWLLFDEVALRTAADNPSGKKPLNLPAMAKLEQLHAKNVLHGLLQEASEKKGRKLKQFSVHAGVHRLAESIDDFSPLRALSAFQALEAEIQEVINTNGWYFEIEEN